MAAEFVGEWALQHNRPLLPLSRAKIHESFFKKALWTSTRSPFATNYENGKNDNDIKRCFIEGLLLDQTVHAVRSICYQGGQEELGNNGRQGKQMGTWE